MNHTKIFKILFTLLVVVLCFGPVGLAGPLGTAFTYQGRLIDANNAADGLYDFQFKLFDANSAGNKLGADVNKPEVDVIDGYFTVELDFGSVFDGNERWLHIGVRPGVQNDPNTYTVLTPRQKLTPTPYAIYAKNGGGAGGSPWQVNGTSIYYNNGNVGIGTTSPGTKLDVAGIINAQDYYYINNKVLAYNADNAIYYGWDALIAYQIFATSGFERVLIDNAGNVGIGTTSPTAKLEVAGQVKITGGSPAAGKVLTSDSGGLGTWQTPAGTPDGDWVISGTDMYSGVSGNVGIGTTSPGAKLDVQTTSGGYGVRLGFGNVLKDWLLANSFYSGWGQSTYALNLGPLDASGQDLFLLSKNSGTMTGMVIKASGNVGIGITNPAAKLSVNGDINAASVYKIGGSPVLSVAGTANTFLGVSAGLSNTTGGYNTFSGTWAGGSNTEGSNNSAMGYLALASNTTGSQNIAVGMDTLELNITGHDNSAVGVAALFFNDTGNYNLAMGESALENNISGSYNTAVGCSAGGSNATGNGNVFIGYGAGHNEPNSSSNKLYIANSFPGALIYGDFSTKYVGINTTTPARNLHINDVMRLQPRASAPSSPGEGDIYMNSTTHKLMVYTGTAWEACN